MQHSVCSSAAMNPSLVSITQNVILGPDCSEPESGAHPVATTELSSTVSLEFKAATMVQKFYRSHRTRRRLADSAVAHKFWWHALDFAFLNNSTISFFKEQKQEAALRRLKRIQSNASRVGKGLAIDGKALKLAFQHWIEAIDPRHRYGHNLQFYYQKWYKNQAGQPFFYWLDVGAGRDVDLKECSRSMLRQQCIKYLGPLEREQYEYKAIDGKIVHKQTGRLLDTAEEYNKAKWIFVMSTSRRLYAGQKIKGKFHHSSFLAGGATVIAGRLVTENGLLKRVWPHSGHYRPTEENLENFTSFLIEHGIDLKDQVSLSYDDNDVEAEKHAQALDTTAVSGVDKAIQVIEVELA